MLGFLSSVFAETAQDAKIRVLEEKLKQQQKVVQQLLEQQTVMLKAIQDLKSSGGAAETVEGALQPTWKSGLRFNSADKAFKLKVGGRIMNDWTFMNGSSALVTAKGALNDGT
jgi:hypothetical protein